MSVAPPEQSASGAETTNPFNASKTYKEPQRKSVPIENVNPFTTANPFNTSKSYKEPVPNIENIRVTQEGDDTVVRIPTAALRRTAKSLKTSVGGGSDGGRKRSGKTSKNKKESRKLGYL
jgi:hypothetical protein